MSDDPLERFRRRDGTRQEPKPKEPGGLPPYDAFEAQDKVLRLDIRCVRIPSHCVANAYLLDIVYSRSFTGFMLLYTFMTVKVKGRNLENVVTALRLGKCAAISEFHAELYAPPEDGKPVITGIEVVTGERAAAMREADVEDDKP